MEENLIKARIRRAGDNETPAPQPESLLQVLREMRTWEYRAGARIAPAVIVANPGMLHIPGQYPAFRNVKVELRGSTALLTPCGSWDVVVVSHGPWRAARVLSGPETARILTSSTDRRGSGVTVLALRYEGVYAVSGEIRRHKAVGPRGPEYDVVTTVDAARALGWLPPAEGEADLVLE